jgi:hypothetical protein
MNITKYTKNNEYTILFLFLSLFLTLNVFTSPKSPTVWVDEVAYSDPSVNFVLNGDFTSTAWGTQGPNELWAGNVPLHQFFLIGWLEVFGVSPTSVRSMNYIFVIVGVILLWFLMRNKDLSSPIFRLATVVLLLCGQGITFSYRSGRPDMIGFLLVCAGAAALLLKGRTRYGLLACTGALIPWAGLQFVPYTALLCGCIIFWNRKLFLRTSLSVAGGGIAGTGGLIWFYKLNSVWDDFLQSVAPHTAASSSVNTFDGLQIYMGDISYLTVLLVSILFLIYKIYKSNFTDISPFFLYGLTAGVLTPIVLYALGKYPQYYTWMAYLPLVTGACIQASFISWSQWKSWIGIGLLGFACVWLPARVGVTILQWEARSYEPIESLAKNTISEEDTVYASNQAYYGAKKNASVVYLPGSLSGRRSEDEKIERAPIDKVIIDPRQSEKLLSELGGEWRQLGQIGEDAERKEILGRKLASPYRLATYVRLSEQ